MLRLRTTTGLNPEEYERMFLLPFHPIEEIMIKQRNLGYAVQTEDNRWHLTPQGFLISNTIISDLLLAQEESVPLRRL